MKAIFLMMAFVPVFAFSFDKGCDVPGDDETLKQFGSARLSHFTPHTPMTMLLWNVYKANREGWEKDFTTLNESTDLTLIQEATDLPVMTRIFEADAKLWHMAGSFFLGKRPITGVATASKVEPTCVTWYRSEHGEPILKTPKMLLVAHYPVEGNHDLLVINIHSINFNCNHAWKAQLSRAFAEISKHHGPVILAGDFNNWQPGRLKFMREESLKLGLTKLIFSRNEGPFHLDHIFVRGIKVPKKHKYKEIKTSDHSPLWMQFEIEDGELI